MSVEKLGETVIVSNPEEKETAYFYMANDPKINNLIYISKKIDDYEEAAKYLKAFNTKLSCYKVYAKPSKFDNIRRRLENYRYKNLDKAISDYNVEEYFNEISWEED
jgi:hypothetical protein